MKILTNLDLSQNEIQNAIMQPLAAPPSNPKLGQIYFNSIDLTLYLWTGEKWIPVPTKLSQLENDSKFITAKDVPEGAVASTTTPKMNGKTQILPLKNGIDFLGFHTYLTQTGKVVRKVRAKSIDNMKRKIRKFRGLVDSGKMTLDSVVQSYASWTGHISHGNTYHLRQNMDAYFFSYFPELKPSPKGDTTHGPKTEQPRKQVEGQVRQPIRQPDRLDRGR